MDQHKLIQSEAGQEYLKEIRMICASLPETIEHIDDFGHTSFRVNKKPYIIMGENGEGTSIAIKPLPTTREVLLQQVEYFKTPYIGQHGWVTRYLDGQVNWTELQDFIKESYLRTAPKRLTKELIPGKLL